MFKKTFNLPDQNNWQEDNNNDAKKNDNDITEKKDNTKSLKDSVNVPNPNTQVSEPEKENSKEEKNLTIREQLRIKLNFHLSIEELNKESYLQFLLINVNAKKNDSSTF